MSLTRKVFCPLSCCFHRPRSLRTRNWSLEATAAPLEALCLREHALHPRNLDGKHLRVHMQRIPFAVSRGNGAKRDGWCDVAVQCPNTHDVQSRWFATQRSPRHPILGLHWKSDVRKVYCTIFEESRKIIKFRMACRRRMVHDRGERILRLRAGAKQKHIESLPAALARVKEHVKCHTRSLNRVSWRMKLDSAT